VISSRSLDESDASANTALLAPDADLLQVRLVGVHSITVSVAWPERQMAEKVDACEHVFVTAQGSPYARFKRPVDHGNLLEADSAARELGQLNLPDALEFCDLLARFAPDRFERAALRWHGRWTTEATPSSLAEAQLALTCLQLLTGDHRSTALSVLRYLAKP
jgi:hypothetical protein